MCLIFMIADIIYHLFDAFTAYNAAILEAKRVDSAPIAVWPCRLKIIQVFAKRDREWNTWRYDLKVSKHPLADCLAMCSQPSLWGVISSRVL